MESALLTTLVRGARRPERVLRLAVDKTRELMFWDRLYEAMRAPKLRGPVPQDDRDQGRLLVELARQGFALRSFRVDPDDFRRFRALARYEQFFAYAGGGRAPDLPEKVLEHYLAATLLDLGPDDVVLDVASQHSPAPAIYERLFGCRAYCQDLQFEPGWHGRRIGGNAASMPIPDGFATALTLHNAFEHFEGDSDARFIEEAGRVLRPGGRMCIVPLFLNNRYAIQCDPVALPAGGSALESDAVAYCARGWRDRHGRFYDVPHLVSRIRDRLGPLRMQILRVENAWEIDPTCYVRYLALFERT